MFYIAIVIFPKEKKSKFQLVLADSKDAAASKVYAHYYAKGVLMDEIDVSIKETIK